MSLLPTHWYYNTETGQLTQGNNLENLGNNLFGGLGWHELNIPGSDTGEQAAAAARKEFPKGATPDYSPVTPAKVAKTAATEAGTSLTGIAAIGDFFSRLENANTWVRIGEVALGLILIAIGLARITHAVPIATSIARTAGAAAV